MSLNDDNTFNCKFSTGSRGYLFIEWNLIGPSRGHGHWGHCDTMGPMLKITSTCGARYENILEIIIRGNRDSLSYVIFDSCGHSFYTLF